MTKILAHKGTFVKKNGKTRDMTFARINDLPEVFLDEVVQGTGQERNYPEGMELVFDLEADDTGNFRIFNHNTVVGNITQVEIELEYFDRYIRD